MVQGLQTWAQTIMRVLVQPAPKVQAKLQLAKRRFKHCLWIYDHWSLIIIKSFINLIVYILTFLLDLIESSSICSNFQVQEAWERSSVTPEVFWLSFLEYSCNRCTNEHATRTSPDYDHSLQQGLLLIMTISFFSVNCWSWLVHDLHIKTLRRWRLSWRPQILETRPRIQ